MPSTVVWTSGASTLTWLNGAVESAPEDYLSTVIVDRLAGGEIDAEDLGIGPLKTRHFTFKQVSDTNKQQFETFRNTVVNGPYLAFTHTDNSQDTPETLTVRLIRSAWSRILVSGTTPVWEIRVSLQVEP